MIELKKIDKIWIEIYETDRVNINTIVNKR